MGICVQADGDFARVIVECGISSLSTPLNSYKDKILSNSLVLSHLVNLIEVLWRLL